MAAQHDRTDETIATELVPFLPLLYVAWADGELEPAELEGLRSRLREASNGEPRFVLMERWLDPDRPPAASELCDLLAALRRSAEPLPRAERLSMSALSRELATRSGREMTAGEEHALLEIEEALGLSGRPLLSRLLPTRGRSPRSAPAEPDPNVAVLAAHLDGETAAVRAELEALLLTPAFALEVPRDREEHRRRVLSWCHRLAAAGVGSLHLPAELGGRDDPAAFLAAFEILAYHDLSLWVKFGVQFGLFAGAIQQLGTADHHRRYLAPATRLELPGCFAMTETEHGSNVAGLETTAVYDAATDELVVDTPHDGACKDYIGGAARDARLAVVFAQLHTDGAARGVHALLVPIRSTVDGAIEPGVRIEDCGDKLGLNGVDNGRIWFHGVRVPRQNLLNRFGSIAPGGAYTSAIASDARRFFTTLGTLVGGRVNVAIAAGSAAKKALTIAIRYGARRRQFAPAGDDSEHPILDYLTHQRKLLPRLATTYALHFALRGLGRDYLLVGDGDRRPLEALVAGLKAYSTWHATDTIQACREACGGAGYMAENQLAALKADTDVFTTFEGDNTVLCQLLVKGLLTGYRQQYADMTVLGLLRHLGARAATAVAELNPVVTRRTDDEHLRSRNFQIDVLRWREDRLLATLARRLKRRIDDGLDSFSALQECGDHVLALARAHVERVVVERFVEGVDSCPDPGARQVLVSLLDLFALAAIESDAGWFLEHDVLAGGKARAVRRLVNRLCGELRPHSLALVEAFSIPDALVVAPIGRR